MPSSIFRPLHANEALSDIAAHATVHDRCSSNLSAVPVDTVISVEDTEFVLFANDLVIEGDIVLRGDLVGL